MNESHPATPETRARIVELQEERNQIYERLCAQDHNARMAARHNATRGRDLYVRPEEWAQYDHLCDRIRTLILAEGIGRH